MWKECLNCGLDIPINERDILEGFVICPACTEKMNTRKLNKNDPVDINLIIHDMIEIEEQNRIKLNNKLKTMGL